MPSSSSPLVSIFLLSYNQEQLITEAVESLLSQTYSPLQIILSDDCSIDNTYAVMQKLVGNYKGPHVIKLNRNESNIGIVEHFKVAQQLAQGELLVATAGDDISVPERCEKIAAAWLEHDKQVDLIASDVFDMSFDGEILGVKKIDKLEQWRNIDDWFSRSPSVLGASHAWTRSLVNRYSEISSEIRGEDHVMIFRAMLTGSAITISEPLVKHRRGGVSRKVEYFDVYKKRKQLIDGALGSIAFAKQCIRDAKIVNQEEIVKAAFKSKMDENQIILDIFDSNSTVEKIKITFKANQISFLKKLRFLIYATFPWIISFYLFIKAYVVSPGRDDRLQKALGNLPIRSVLVARTRD